jgi:hypothetical protein
MDNDNPRLQDLKLMVEECNEKRVNLVLLLLVPNRAHADSLFGKQLTQYIDYNLEFLRSKIRQWRREIETKQGDCASGLGGLTLVDIPALYQKNYGSFPSSSHYTDQFFPTEHVDAHVRGFIAYQLAQALRVNYFQSKTNQNRKVGSDTFNEGYAKFPMIIPAKNNTLNPDLHMPTSDSMMSLWRKKP